MTSETKELLHQLANKSAEELYDQYGAQGLWVAKDELPSHPSGFTEEEYENLLSPERLEEIQSGQPPNEAELLALREARLEKMLDPGSDADAIPAYCLAEVADDENNTGIALILCTGYSFSGVNISVEGVFDTRKDALAYLTDNGWVSCV